VIKAPLTKYLPQVRLDVMPGLVDHEIFVNECDAPGRDRWPEACIDADGVDRGKLHDYIGRTALQFFDLNLGVQRGARTNILWRETTNPKRLLARVWPLLRQEERALPEICATASYLH